MHLKKLVLNRDTDRHMLRETYRPVYKGKRRSASIMNRQQMVENLEKREKKEKKKKRNCDLDCVDVGFFDVRCLSSEDRYCDR
jgi:hypothetical protein